MEGKRRSIVKVNQSENKFEMIFSFVIQISKIWRKESKNHEEHKNYLHLNDLQNSINYLFARKKFKLLFLSGKTTTQDSSFQSHVCQVHEPSPFFLEKFSLHILNFYTRRLANEDFFHFIWKFSLYLNKQLDCDWVEMSWRLFIDLPMCAHSLQALDDVQSKLDYFSFYY